MTAASGSAAAAVPIEGVWSFSGGKIAIHQEGTEGTYVGTVIAETTFASCPHKVGEQIWTDIALQPDGSYWGLHQWFYEDNSCTPNPELGLTAFRVLTNNSGRFLRVCLSEPVNGEQPTIDAAGKSAHVSYGCRDSELISELPSSSDLSAKHLIRLRSSTTCLAPRTLRIHIREPTNDSVVKVTVTVSGGGVTRQAKVVRTKGKGAVAIVKTGAIPSSKLVVNVRLDTALGHTIKTKRTYRSCAAARRHRKHHGTHA